MADDVDPQNEASRADAPFVSLYRRFRPGRFGELRGQAHVVRALQGAVRDGRVSHAYLFSGPRGTGKTSTARILARALNCTAPVDGEPCGVCASCVEIAKGTSLDVHELDAASNNGVDAMRDLISHAALATPGRWKVYIVDEVHMLSNAAANALLKTLEEPPGHVVFVLATTDPQKVPPTIRSRTQHLEFGLLGADILAGLLRDVSAAAGLDLEDEDLSVAVRKGRGSARDALSALDQVVASGSAEALRPDVVALTRSVAEEDAHRALAEVAALHESGWGPQQIATELVDELRQMFLVALAPDLCGAAGAERDRLVTQAASLGLSRVVRAIEAIGRAQVDMRDAPDGRAVLEVALVRLARPELDDSATALLDRIARLEQALSGGGSPRLVAGPPGEQGSSPASPPRPAAAAPPAAAPRTAASPAAAPPPFPPASPTAAVAPVTEGDRPSLGALRRQRTSMPAAPSRPSPAKETPLPDDTTDATATTSATATTDATGPSAAVPPDRDGVVQAWGDHILRGLPARAKALYSPGRFVAVEDTTVTFALPNAVHRDKCEEVRVDVERAISAHFKTPLQLRLIVDAGGPGAAGMGTSPKGSPTPSASPPPSRPFTPSGPSASSPPPGAPVSGADVSVSGADVFGLDPGDEIDPDQPAGSIEQVAKARLLEAFPGAQEMQG